MDKLILFIVLCIAFGVGIVVGHFIEKSDYTPLGGTSDKEEPEDLDDEDNDIIDYDTELVFEKEKDAID